MGKACSKKEENMSNSKLFVSGGAPLKGKIRISGAKNAVLPIMAASILSEETVILSNVPHLRDVDAMISLLQAHGVTVDKSEFSRHILKLKAARITTTESPPELSSQMRASVLVLGPLLGRCNKVTTLQPGGCKIGKRPIDIHLSGLRKLGAEIQERGCGRISASVSGNLRGCHIDLKLPSVGATENILMAACLADGDTTIHNAAKEPEVCDLARFLNKMGARISGIGTSTLTVRGVTKLTGTSHEIVPDRIEAGTYAIAACATRGEVELEGVDPETMESTLRCLEQAGARVVRKANSVAVSMDMETTIQSVSIRTEPYPGFPTDMQSQWLALMCLAKGKSVIEETLFENRFKHIPELCRMGASISCAQDGRSVTVNGIKKLRGAEVRATDLRASASLLIAALSAQGRTVIKDIHHLERGYEEVVEKLRGCGANIRK